MKAFFRTYWILITTLVLFLICRIATIPYHGVPYWDGAIYVGMGKYLFTHGAVGTWETLRPVFLPIILGAAWKMGLNPYVVGTVLVLTVSVATLLLAYFFSEDIKRGSGEITVLLLATTGIFFTYSAVPITDVISTFFALCALWLIYKAQSNKQYLAAGLVVACAFMFRFPQGLLLPVGILAVFIKMFQEKGKWNDRIIRLIERVFTVGAGFCIIVVPFLIANYYFYHNAFLPFVEGTQGINNYPSLYDKGVWFYIVQLLKNDFLYIAAVIPAGLLFWKKGYRSQAVIALVTVLVIVGGYFTLYQTHKELRYALAFLPYLAILAGVGVMYVLEWTKMPRLLFFGLFVIVAFMVSVGMFVYGPADADATMFYQFNTYLAHVPDGTPIMTTSPYLLAYTNVRITHNLYADWNAAYSDYNSFKSTNEYIMLNSCGLDLGCADDAGHCTDDRSLLLTEIKKEDTLVFKTTTPMPDSCTLAIYQIGH